MLSGSQSPNFYAGEVGVWGHLRFAAPLSMVALSELTRLIAPRSTPENPLLI